MTIPCIIPARGGSKGIPHKNLVPVAGKPLIVWSIEQAQAADSVGPVCVSTDCEEIAIVAEAHCAAVHWRSSASATDDAPSEMSLMEAIDAFYPDERMFVFLQATSPMRRRHDIDHAMAQLQASDADCLFSACVVHGYMWERWHETIMPRYSKRRMRQEQIVRRLEENGSIYICSTEILRRTGKRLGGKIEAYEMPRLYSFQIDDPEDVETIERLMTLERLSGSLAEML